MLRNYKHPHLVEFIGTAMAVERGADTVRETQREGVGERERNISRQTSRQIDG